MEWCSQKPINARSHQKLKEARKNSSLEPSESSHDHGKLTVCQVAARHSLWPTPTPHPHPPAPPGSTGKNRESKAYIHKTVDWDGGSGGKLRAKESIAPGHA